MYRLYLGVIQHFLASTQATQRRCTCKAALSEDLANASAAARSKWSNLSPSSEKSNTVGLKRGGEPGPKDSKGPFLQNLGGAHYRPIRGVAVTVDRIKNSDSGLSNPMQSHTNLPWGGVPLVKHPGSFIFGQLWLINGWSSYFKCRISEWNSCTLWESNMAGKSPFIDHVPFKYPFAGDSQPRLMTPGANGHTAEPPTSHCFGGTIPAFPELRHPRTTRIFWTKLFSNIDE